MCRGRIKSMDKEIHPSSDLKFPARVLVDIAGRLMLASSDEFACKVIDMSAADMHVYCVAFPQIGERIIAYLDHVGRMEGTVAALADHGFIVALNITDRKREKLAAQLNWLANQGELPEERRHQRTTPRSEQIDLTLEDGSTFPCRILDLSISGAAVEIDIRPAIGTTARLGTMCGRIVRHLRDGVAIEFNTYQTSSGLPSAQEGT